MINQPPHYTFSAVEPIDVIEAWSLGFHLGNVVKYLARCQRKGRLLEDLKKARWYLDRYISVCERVLPTAPRALTQAELAEMVAAVQASELP